MVLSVGDAEFIEPMPNRKLLQANHLKYKGRSEVVKAPAHILRIGISGGKNGDRKRKNAGWNVV